MILFVWRESFQSISANLLYNRVSIYLHCYQLGDMGIRVLLHQTHNFCTQYTEFGFEFSPLSHIVVFDE